MNDILQNLLIEYVSKEIKRFHEDEYLSSLINHTKEKLIVTGLENLFSKKEEIHKMLKRIAGLKLDDLFRIADNSFSSSHKEEAKELIFTLLKRQKMYARTFDASSSIEKAYGSPISHALFAKRKALPSLNDKIENKKEITKKSQSNKKSRT